MSKEHLMIDIETLDTKPTAAVLSIGAMFFDPLSGDLGEYFNRQVSLKSCTALGLTVDPDTIMWWMQQSDAARGAFKGNEKAGHLSEVLCHLSRWVKGASGFNDDIKVWGNGKEFDCTILENAYRAAGIQDLTPWKFWNTMDVRTLVALGKMAGSPNFKADIEFVGTKHDALDDVRHQIKYVSAYTRFLTGNKEAV
jgi:hypothetical protein